jgi:ribosomal protein S18 acetylase RimI-like enzyme
MTDDVPSTPSVALACPSDAEPIVQLMEANHLERGGSLSAKYTREQVSSLMQTTPIIVAHHDLQLVGFLMTCPRSPTDNPPIVRAMLAAYPGGHDAYVYGPICVAAAWRGQGLAQRMFAELRRHLPRREGILFVRSDNTASLRAHAKMGMSEVAHFSFRDAAHTVFAYSG